MLKLEQEINITTDERKKAYLTLELGIIEASRRNYAKSVKFICEAKDMFKKLNDNKSIAECLIEESLISYQSSSKNLANSISLLNEADNVIKGINNTNNIKAKILHYYGTFYYSEKRYTEALIYYTKAQKQAENNTLEYAKILDSFAIFYLRLNNQQLAVKCLNESLKIKKKLNKTYETGYTELLYGRYLSSIENYEEATVHLSKALAANEEICDDHTVARILDELAKIYIQLNKYELALDYYSKSVKIAKNIEPKILHAFISCTGASIEILKNKPETALNILEGISEPIFNSYNFKRGIALAYRTKGQAYNKLGKQQESVDYLKKSLELYKEAGIPIEIARCCYELGKIVSLNNELPLAISYLFEAMKVAKLYQLPYLTSNVEQLLHNLMESQLVNITDNTFEIKENFEKGTALFDTLAISADISSYNQSLSEPLIPLLNIGKAISQETDINKTLDIVAEETKKALNADRCSLFLLDKSTNELYSRVASDLGGQEIRFPSNLGLAGYVAMTGEIVNIKDAYNDPLFNRDVDKKTGYKTDTILCVPMRNSNHEIVGVLEVINKRGNTHFTDKDIDLLVSICASVGASLDNIRLLQKQVLMYKEQEKSFRSFINTLAASIDARDKITAGHSDRVTRYARLIAEQIGFSSQDKEVLEVSATLHDIGKLGVKDCVLCKEGKLTDEEYKHIQEHARITYEILNKLYFEDKFSNIPEIAASHHEKFNGSGYYRGLKGDEIPLGGRVIAIADVFDAITSKRHYRDRMPFDKVLDILRKDSGSHFDGKLVDEFFKINLLKIITVLSSRNDEIITEKEESIFRLYSLSDLHIILQKAESERTEENKKVLASFEKHYYAES